MEFPRLLAWLADGLNTILCVQRPGLWDQDQDQDICIVAELSGSRVECFVAFKALRPTVWIQETTTGGDSMVFICFL